jgi:NitT/TauT family transport system ATP-binding protein
MFQESALFPWLNAFGNVMFGLRRLPGLTNTPRREIADHHLRLVGLSKLSKAYVHELSGGMKQRVALPTFPVDRIFSDEPSRKFSPQAFEGV